MISMKTRLETSSVSFSETFPSVSLHRCHCVSVKYDERVLSVDSLGVWPPAPLPTSRAPPDRGALWPLAWRKIWAVSMFDLAL